jgi:hypothetical protein
MRGQVYQHHIFISYRRSPTVGVWVKNHLFPRLVARLDDVAPHPIKVSCDLQISDGTNWPDELGNRIKSSAILLAVWSADYFRSHWCLKEWLSFREREKFLGFSTTEKTGGLIYPIRYSDGSHYHQDAKVTQCAKDFGRLNAPDEVFSQSTRYLEFDDMVSQMARELVEATLLAPPWRPDFPIVEPQSIRAPSAVPLPLI